MSLSSSADTELVGSHAMMLTVQARAAELKGAVGTRSSAAAHGRPLIYNEDRLVVAADCQ
jgi:hypothetical protein